MQFLWIIVSLIMSVLSVDAQSVDKQSVPIVKESLVAKLKNSEKDIQKEEKTETANDDKKNKDSKDKSDKNKDSKQVQKVNAKSKEYTAEKKEYTQKAKENIIIDDSNAIFPKSKTNFFINPIFKNNEFRASEAFKQDKNIGFQPEATSGKGINSQFLTPRKQIQEKDIPPELKHLFKDKVY